MSASGHHRTRALRTRYYAELSLFVSCLLGCQHLPSLEQRQNLAIHQAEVHHWVAEPIQTGTFSLQSFRPANPSTNDSSLIVYIEGDGLAWISKDQASQNPTPLSPLGLKLALNDPNKNVAYLARPCQFVEFSALNPCTEKDWTSGRYSPKIIAAMSQALNQLKHRYQARELILVGYSGGGAVAALLSVKRTDVIKLITVAGNLDTQNWTDTFMLDPLIGSLNPANEVTRLSKIPQVHFIGDNDTVIPVWMTERFVKRMNAPETVKVIRESGFTHQCCWVEAWPALLNQALK